MRTNVMYGVKMSVGVFWLHSGAILISKPDLR
jgi:hypothetical protein